MLAAFGGQPLVAAQLHKAATADLGGLGTQLGHVEFLERQAAGDLRRHRRPGGGADDHVGREEACRQMGVHVGHALQDPEFPGDARHPAAGEHEGGARSREGPRRVGSG